MYWNDKIKKTSLLILVVIMPLVVKSQITIGSDVLPLAGVLLDLKELGTNETPNKRANANRGLLLPRIALTDLNSLVDIGVDLSSVDASSYTGMIVYHIEGESEIKAGIYVWDGEKWSLVKKRNSPNYELITTTEDNPLKQPNCYMGFVNGKKKLVKIPIAKAFDVWDGSSWKREVYDKNLKKFIKAPLLPTGRNISTTDLKADLIWKEVEKGFISDISLSGMTRNDTISVLVDGTAGNAVVALKDGNDIIWSWHIWITPPINDSDLIEMNDMTWMKRNLGSTSIEAKSVNIMGLHYQWGRKDPFPPSAAWNQNVERTLYGPNGESMKVTDGGRQLTNDYSDEQNLTNSIKNPFSFIQDNGSTEDWFANERIHLYDYNWRYRWMADYAGNLDAKSVSDPCPEGWCIPRKTSGTGSKKSSWASMDLDKIESNSESGIFVGFSIEKKDSNPVVSDYYPVAGARDGKKNAGELINTGVSTHIFGSKFDGTKFVTSLNIKINLGKPNALPATNEPRSRGNSVRCVKDN